MSYDDFITALTIWREARGEPYTAKLGVANVIYNRVADGRWKPTPHEVCLQKLQFSSFNPGDPNATRLPRITEAVDWAAWLDSCRAAEEGKVVKIVGNATHYHDVSIATPPGWKMAQVAEIGRLKFFYEPRRP